MVNLMTPNLTDTIVKVGPFPIYDYMPDLEEIFPEETKLPSEKPKNDNSELLNGFDTLSIKEGEYRTDINPQDKISLDERPIRMTTCYIEDILQEAEDKRRNKIFALLLRPEALEILEILSYDNKIDVFNIITKTKSHFHAMADLINQDLISIENNIIVMTPLCKRVINDIFEERWND